MNGRQDSVIPWTSLIVTSLVLAGLVLSTPGLEVGRPVKDVPAGDIPVRDAVYARLWQDPLAAVKPAVDLSQGSTAAGAEVRRLEFGPADSVLVVPVLVPGSPFSESEEQRIRTRYAVHAGLSFAGLMPLDRDKLRYIRVDAAPSDPRPFAVPYEWFTPDSTGPPIPAPERVLVVWIDEDAILAANHNAIAGLVHVLEQCTENLHIPTGQVTIRVIGPDSSDSLMRLCMDLDRLHGLWQGWNDWKRERGLTAPGASRDALEEAWQEWRTASERRVVEAAATYQSQRKPAGRKGGDGPTGPPPRQAAMLATPALADFALTLFEGRDDPPNAPPRFLCHGMPRMTFYAARPTAPYTALERALGANRGWIQRDSDESSAGDRRYDRFAKSFGSSTIKLIRSAGDDSQLVDDLVAELDARGVLSSWMPGDHCVIIRERETFFGRRIGDAMREALDRRGIGGTAISFLGYERGLDGEIPSGSGGAGGTAKSASSADFVAAAGDLLGSRFRERSESRGQIDYFRRAAEHLRDDRRVRVVCIVGTDVYDKLILLRALRPVLGNCVFVTTDLDARLLHREEASFTRNLVVASHYGLTLSPTSPLPPFRDTYQTAIFDATLRILDINEEAGLDAAANAWSFEPEALDRWFKDRTRGVYEIGRSLAHRLPPVRGQSVGTVMLAAEGATRDRAGMAASHPQPQPETDLKPGQEATSSKQTLQEDRARAVLRLRSAGLAAISVGTVLATVLGAAWLASRRRGPRAIVRMLLVWALPIAGVLAAIAPWWLAAGRTEPSAPLDGVDVAPAILLQLVSVVVAAWFLAGGRGVYGERDPATSPWRMIAWGLVPFLILAVLGIAAGAWKSYGLTVGMAELWVVRSEPLRWAAIIAHTLAMSAVAGLAGLACACSRRAIGRVRALQASRPADPTAVRAALEESESLARGADRMALQVSQVVMILIVSMLPIFERWPIRPFDVVFPVAAGLLALVAAGRVTSAGTALRNDILHRIRERLLATPNEPRLTLAAQLITDHGSAQQPIHRRLLLTALALPLGGVSLIQLLPVILGR